MTMTQTQILQSVYELTEGSHDIKWDGKVIKGKKLINHRSWASFTLTFLNNGEEISFNARNITKRFNLSSFGELKDILEGFEVI